MILKITLLTFFIALNSFATNCRTKLVPKLDLLLVIGNYKTEWIEHTGISKYSACVKNAEIALTKANVVKAAETLEEVFEQLWDSYSNPDYFKAVKIEFEDENGKILRNTLTFKKKS